MPLLLYLVRTAAITAHQCLRDRLEGELAKKSMKMAVKISEMQKLLADAKGGEVGEDETKARLLCFMKVSPTLFSTTRNTH